MLKGKKILVVEDNEVNQKLIDFVLKKAGAVVDIANQGKHAIEFLEKYTMYDLVIMDLQMPVMDGYATTKYIRNDLKLNMPIIAMTATALKTEQDKCFQYGMNDYMTKPFDFNDLYKRIAKQLGGQPAVLPVLTDKKSGPVKLYNLSLLEDLNDKDSLIEVANMFLNNTPRQLDEMMQDAKQHNWEKVFYEAHKIKGSAGMLQAHELIEVLMQVEKKAKEEKDVHSIEGLIDKAIGYFAQINTELKAEIKKMQENYA